MNSRIRILIADDHPLIRSGLRQVLAGETDLECVAEASDGAQALLLIREKAPDIAILDLEMPGSGGLEVARDVKEKHLPTDVVILTMYREEDMFNAAMDLGVRGYVLKDSAVTEIVSCIRMVDSGKYYFSPELSNYLVARSSRVEHLLRTKPELDDLTPAERRVLALIAGNRTSKDIAEELHISPKTVDNHRANISAKLHLRGSHSVLNFAIAHKHLLSRY